jgi:uncharacterized protein (DUF885 family)
MRRLALALLPLSLAAGAAQAANAEFGRFVDEYFDAAVRDLPNFATYLGVHAYDERIDDLSRAGFEQRIADKKKFLDRLAAIDRSKLDFDEQVDAEAIEATSAPEFRRRRCARGNHRWITSRCRAARSTG